MSEASVTTPSPPGWFGKIPNLGDFVSRRLPDEFVQPWDDWLQRSLRSTRRALGEAWLARYLVAPVRRFWLAPGVLGDTGWAGLMMPSVDRVGRHFPLTLATPADRLDAVLAARGWLQALDGVARQVLDVDFTADDFEGQLAALGPMAPDAQGTAGASPPSCDDHGSVWWCDGAAGRSDFRCFAALPPPAAFAALLTQDGGAAT